MEIKGHENETWWQENGLTWGNEVDRRRSTQPLYGIQEVVLSHIFSEISKGSKVMEFGVGFGRHIEYLSDIPDLQVYGVDQSPTMIQSLKDRLSHKPNLIENVSLIEPRSKLPFPDDYFDFVYTVSVLIHINPSDIDEILKELSRVTKHGIIHFENNFVEHSELKYMDHNGCWQHSIINNYKNLGLSCTIFEKAAFEQDIYYTSLSGEWSKDDLENSVMFSRLHLIDSKIRPTIAKFEGEVGWRTKELTDRIEHEKKLKEDLEQQKTIVIELNEELKKREKVIGDLKENLQVNLQNAKKIQSENSKLNGLYHDLININNTQENDIKSLKQELGNVASHNIYLESRLYDIESSLGWRLITKLRGMHYLYMVAKPARKLLNVFRSYRKVKNTTKLENSYLSYEVGNETLKREEDKKFSSLFEMLQKIPEASDIAIYQPEWLGVSNSTKELFEHSLPIKELFDSNHILSIGHLILGRKPKVIIFSGFAIGYDELAKVLKKLDANISIKVYWHGNTTHMYEDYSWSRYQEIIQLSNEGIVDSWGFAKESMKILYEKAGYTSFFVKNTVKGEILPEKSTKSFDLDNGVKIGIYASGNTWNKNAYTQIAAASLLDNVTISAVPYNNRMKHFAQQLKVKFEGAENQIPREELLEKISANDINFYVTFSECAPLLPLESMNRGVPCLTGPNHHYFIGSPLEEFLIVNRPDDPVEISSKARYALKNKELIIKLYNEWKNQNDLESEISITSFIEGK